MIFNYTDKAVSLYKEYKNNKDADAYQKLFVEIFDNKSIDSYISGFKFRDYREYDLSLDESIWITMDNDLLSYKIEIDFVCITITLERSDSSLPSEEYVVAVNYEDFEDGADLFDYFLEVVQDSEKSYLALKK